MLSHLARLACLVLGTSLFAGCALVIHPTGEAEERQFHQEVGASHGYIGQAEPPQLTKRSLLRDVLCYADTCNGELRSSWHEWRAALERVPQAGALDDPMFMFGYDFALDPFNRGDSGSSDSGMDKWSVDRILLGYQQNIRNPSKRVTRAERALFEAMSTAERYRRTRFDVRNRVIAAYAELLYNQQVLELENQNLRLLTQIFDIASHQFHAGQLQQVDVARLEIEILRAKSQVRAVEIERDRRVAELNALLDRKPRDKFGRLGLGDVRLKSESPDKLLQIAACNNPDLAQTQRDIQARGADVVLADLENLPDFQINLPQVQTLSQMVMFGVSLPINRERIDAGIREAEATRDAALARLHNQQSSALARVMVGLAMLRDAQRVLADFSGPILARTNEVLTLQQQYYGTGSGDITSVLYTQRTLIELQRLVERAQVDRVRAMGEIEAVAGCELMRLGITSEKKTTGTKNLTETTSQPLSTIEPAGVPTAIYTTTETLPAFSPGVTPLDSGIGIGFPASTPSPTPQPAPAGTQPDGATTLPPLPTFQPFPETTSSSQQLKRPGAKPAAVHGAPPHQSS